LVFSKDETQLKRVVEYAHIKFGYDKKDPKLVRLTVMLYLYRWRNIGKSM